MDLRQLRSFLAVVDHGSFSAAASALFTVQSNVSSHVARLEEEVGSSLLDRRTRELTPAGGIVERRGREIMRQLNAISDDLDGLENRILGDVVIGTTPSIGLRVIPPALARAANELPEVTVSVVEAHSGTLVQQLLAGDIDLAITTGASNPELVSSPLFTEDIMAVFGSAHPLADRPELNLSDLNHAKLLLPLSDNPLHDHIVRAFAAHDVQLGIGLEVGSSAMVQAMAAAGVGVAIVPATAASDSSNSTAITRPIEDMPPRRVALTTRRDAQPSRAQSAIFALVDHVARNAASSMPGCSTSA